MKRVEPNVLLWQPVRQNLIFKLKFHIFVSKGLQGELNES